MRTSHRTALALVLVCLVVPAVARAGDLAFSANCHIETVVGSASGSAPELRLVFHDINNLPLGGQIVRVDFGATGFRLFGVQDAGVTVDCATHVLRKLTNAAGEVVFHPRFGGTEAGSGIRIDSNGIIVGYVAARSTDLDGLGAGTGLPDLALFATAFASAQPHAEANFDRSASDVPDLADVAIFSAQLASGAVQAYCP